MACSPGWCLHRGRVSDQWVSAQGDVCLGVVSDLVVGVHLPLWTESQTGVKTLPFRYFIYER